MHRFEIPDWLRYDCSACGLCCRRGFNIWCPEANRTRLAKVDWGTKYPQLAGKRLFLPYQNNYRMELDENGTCVFLDTANRCIQHAELGFDAKTLTCKMFPFTLVHSYGRVHVGLLHSCPAVLDEGGTPVREQTGLLKKLATEMDRLFPPPPLTEETALDSLRSISFRNLRFLEEALIEILFDPERPLIRKILCAGILLDRLDEAAVEQLDAKHFPETLQHHQDKARDEATHCGLRHEPLGIFERVFLRELQGVCSSLAESGMASSRFRTRQKSRLQRMGLAVRYLFGIGTLPGQQEEWAKIEGASASGFANRISFRQAQAVHCHHLPPESEILLARYLSTRIAARTYFGKAGWGLAILPGARVILSLAAVTLWHAKFRAAAIGRDHVTHADVRAAILLVEHTFSHMSNLNAGSALKALHIVNRARWPQRALLHTMLPA